MTSETSDQHDTGRAQHKATTAVPHTRTSPTTRLGSQHQVLLLCCRPASSTQRGVAAEPVDQDKCCYMQSGMQADRRDQSAVACTHATKAGSRHEQGMATWDAKASPHHQGRSKRPKTALDKQAGQAMNLQSSALDRRRTASCSGSHTKTSTQRQAAPTAQAQPGQPGRPRQWLPAWPAAPSLPPRPRARPRPPPSWQSGP